MDSKDYCPFLRVMFEIGATVRDDYLRFVAAEIIGIAERQIRLNDEGEAD
jgi:hypothetical protein